jgi:hypothetical protein
MARRSFLERAYRSIHHAVFHASREGRAAEIVGWSNLVASVGLGVGAFVRTHAWLAFVVVTAGTLVLLRLALTHRVTVPVAGLVGTVAVAATGGGLCWVLAHVIESIPSAPMIAAALGALASAVLPVWGYRRIAHLREHTRDSLVDPVSVPSSRS